MTLRGFRILKFTSCVLVTLALAFDLASSVSAQSPTGVPKRSLITGQVSAANMVTLRGNTRPEAKAANDRGIVPDSFPMEHMLLQLRRPAELEEALTKNITQLNDPASPNHHRWLTPEQFGAQFGRRAPVIRRSTDGFRPRGFRADQVNRAGFT